jgi:hypothetical protein
MLGRRQVTKVVHLMGSPSALLVPSLMDEVMLKTIMNVDESLGSLDSRVGVFIDTFGMKVKRSVESRLFR